jgi:hypothetical protein
MKCQECGLPFGPDLRGRAIICLGCGISFHRACGAVCRGCGEIRNPICLFVDGICIPNCDDSLTEVVQCRDCELYGPRSALITHERIKHGKAG